MWERWNYIENLKNYMKNSEKNFHQGNYPKLRAYRRRQERIRSRHEKD